MDRDLQKIDLSIPPEKVLKVIAKARERKSNQKETFKLIEETIEMTQSYIVNLYFERVHMFQLVYMIERDKLGKGNTRKKRLALKKMEEYIKSTEKYIKENKLDEWLHRLYRFYGKLNEYKRNYKVAKNYYAKSLKFWKNDPEVAAEGLPRNLELEGFLSSALIMSNEAEKGLKMAREVFDKYEKTKEGRSLKSKDYTTWAIWRSGLVIYVTRGLLGGKIKIDKKFILSWLNEAERFLYPQRSVNTWSDFQFRKDEINALKKRLVEN